MIRETNAPNRVLDDILIIHQGHAAAISWRKVHLKGVSPHLPPLRGGRPNEALIALWLLT
jgi:hypothetical protein